MYIVYSKIGITKKHVIVLSATNISVKEINDLTERTNVYERSVDWLDCLADLDLIGRLRCVTNRRYICNYWTIIFYILLARINQTKPVYEELLRFFIL